ncbi:amino acid adenylation domain-containing protein [Streptomyces hirsutus]|uniref:non-ribosomal peptide synthetase n=1 Tax=Streptomyces hirsutus TaxID=35620 RepID=UPI003866411C|nr:amino acid adenylation domain-containing protein [Streptomyces hirsutus]
MSRPATPGQLRFFLLDGQDQDAARTLVKHITVEGATDPARLRDALRAVVTAHPALRTSLHLDGDGLVQRVHEPHAVETVVRETPDPDTLLAAERAALAVPFAHGRGPLCRIRALVGPDRTHCLVAVHHAVFDDDSTAVLLSRFARAYTDPVSLTAEPDVTDPAPAGQPERLRGFWRRYLADCPPETELPWQTPTDDHRRETRDRILPQETCDGVRQRAQLTGASPFAQFLTAVAVATSWYLDRDDLVLAVPVSGRTGGEETIGCLQNTVPVRVGLAGADTSSAMERTADALLDALEHARLPFEDILDSVGAARRPGRKPLAQILCTETVPVPAVEADGLLWTVSEGTADEAEYDCCLALCHLPDGRMRVELAYRRGALPPERARNTVDHVARLLGELAEEPVRPLAALGLLVDAERDELSVLDAGPLAPDPRPVHELVFRHTRDTPAATAITADGRTLSYADLEQQSRTVARALHNHGVRAGDRVGICLPRGTDLVVAVLGVWTAGAVYVPLDPEYPDDRIDFVTRDAAPTALLGDRDLPPVLRRSGVPALDIGAALRDAAKAAPRAHPDSEPGPATAPDPAGRAYVIYTSGSTGRPKGVAVLHAQLTALFEACDRALPDAPVTVAGTSLSFDISALELLWPLTRGRTVLVTGHRQVTEEDVPAGALYQCTPTVARLLLADPAGRALLGRLAALLVGGEPLPRDVAEQLTAVVPGPVVNCYGPTETTVWSTVWPVTPGTPVHIGLPLPGETCHVLDRLGRTLPPGCPGRLVISGTGVAEGYWNRPELTRERFVRIGGSGPLGYDTGDLAVLDGPDGLRFLGRRDGQVKILGRRVELEEIEATLRPHTTHGIAVAPDADATRLVAFLPDGTAPPGPATTAEAQPSPAAPDVVRRLRAHAEAWLPRAVVPAAYVHVPALPQLPNGKLDRATLSCWAAVRRPEPTAGPSPAGGTTEARIHQVWESVLGLPVQDRDAPFFELGGTSYGVLRVLAALRAEHPRLTVADLFRHTTARALAAHLDRATPPGDSDPAPTRAPAPGASPTTGQARAEARSRALSGWSARRTARPSSTR